MKSKTKLVECGKGYFKKWKNALQQLEHINVLLVITAT